jgi:hypothetical protein
MDTNKLREKRR